MRATCAVLIAVAGCSFDSALPNDLDISCEGQGVCPKGWTCSLQSRKCRRDSEVGEAPVLASEGISASRVTHGAHLSMVVTSSVALERAPVLSAFSAAASLPAPSLESAEGTRFTYGLTIDSAFPEGLVTLVGSALTPQGAVVEGVRLGTFEVDLTAPTLRRSSLSATVLRPGATLSLQAELDEPIAATVRLRVEPSQAEAVLLEPESLGSGLISFGYRIPSDASDGPVRFTLTLLSDLAGNHAGELPLQQLEVDGRAPTLQPLGVSGRTFSAMPGFNQLTVRAAADEVSTLEVCLGERPCVSPGDGGLSTFTITAADPEGPQFVVVRATDSAGNVGLRSDAVLFDFTPPSVTNVVSAIVAPAGCPLRRVAAASPLGSFELQLTVSEPLVRTPEVRTGDWTLSPQASSGGVMSYLLIPHEDVEQVAPVVTTLEDLVGNSAAVTLLNRLVLDSETPSDLSPRDLDGLLYERAPWGSDETGYSPRFSVLIDGGSIVGPGETLVFADQPGTNAPSLGQSQLVDGGAERVVLNTGDRQRMWVRRLDSACNTSPSALIRENEWLATNSEASDPPSASATIRDHGNFPMPVSRSGNAPALPFELVLNGKPQWVPVDVQPRVPALRQGVRGAYHAAIRRLIFFGGSTYDDQGRRDVFDSNGAWYDGVLWRTMLPTGPSGRVQHAMAYDPKHRRLVMAGGSQFVRESGLFEMWAMKSTSWSAIEVPLSIQPSFSASLSYDERRRALLVIGGGVWSLDGETWATVPAPPAVTAMLAPLAVWDPFARRTVVWGDGATFIETPSGWSPVPGAQPLSASQLLVDEAQRRVLLIDAVGGAMWALQGNQWARLSPGPAQLVSAVAAHETAARRTVLLVPRSLGLVETYVLGSAGLVSLGLSPGSTRPGAEYQLFYDPVRERVVRLDLGAREGYPVTESFELAGDVWVSASSTPTSRDDFARALDDTTLGRTVFFGARPPPNVGPGRTAVLDDLGFRVLPTPPELQDREGFAWVHDPDFGRTILFGGSLPNGTKLSDTWVLGATGWSRLGAAGPVSARSGAGLVHDPVGHRVVLVGGLTQSGLSNELWQLVGSTWSQLTSPTQFSPRAPIAFFDGARGRVVIGGSDTWELVGSSLVPVTTTPGPSFWRSVVTDPVGHLTLVDTSDDFQTFFNGAWSPLTTPWPGARSGVAVAAAPQGGLVLFGGQNAGHFNDTYWVKSPSSLLSIEPHPDLEGRARALVASDTARGRVILLGGEQQVNVGGGTQINRYSDFWALEPSRALGPAYVLSFPVTEAVPSAASVQSMSVSVWGAADSVLSSQTFAAGSNRLPDGGALWPDGGVAPPPMTTLISTPGIQVDTWDPHTGRRVLLGHGTTPTSVGTSPTPVTATLLPNGQGSVDAGGHALLERLIEEDAVTLQLTTRGGADPTPGAAPPQLVFDRYEVRIHYRAQ